MATGDARYFGKLLLRQSFFGATSPQADGGQVFITDVKNLSPLRGLVRTMKSLMPLHTPLFNDTRSI
jgi:hypothetical protein